MNEHSKFHDAAINAGWLRSATPPRLTSLSRHFPARRDQRAVRALYREGWRLAIELVGESIALSHEDGNVGFRAPGGEELWIVPESAAMHAQIRLGYSGPEGRDWCERPHTADRIVAPWLDGLEEEVLRRVRETPLADQLKIRAFLDRESNPPDWLDIEDFLGTALAHAIGANLDLERALALAAAQFPLDPVIMRLWARVMAQFGVPPRPILVDEYNVLSRCRALMSALEATEPGLLWLAALYLWPSAGQGYQDQPVAWLRRELRGLGLTRASWARITQIRPETLRDMYCAHNVHTYGYLLSHWLREQFVDRLVATGSAEADWLAGFELGGQPADRVRLRHLQLDPGVARAIACEGLERLAANDFEPFAAERLPLVLAWLQAEEPLLDANQRRAGWPNLFERAQRWQAEREARQNLAGLRWPVGPAPLVFDGCSVEPIADAFTLWREALAMHHCVGTYADECAQGVMRVFHVDLAGSPKGATLALRWSASGWRRFDFKEPANRIPDAEAGRWADRFVDWYGALPDNESDSVAEESIFFEEDGHDHSCPVCGDECCADHLLAVMESGCSMEGGLLYEDWHRAKARHMDLLRAAFLAGQSRTGLDGEMDALLEAIAVKCPVRELELFEDAAAELDADGEIRRLLEERLWNDPWADRRYYIIEGMPGASSSGHYYWTDDPEKSIASFRALAGLDQNVSDNGMRPA